MLHSCCLLCSHLVAAAMLLHALFSPLLPLLPLSRITEASKTAVIACVIGLSASHRVLLGVLSFVHQTDSS